MTPIKLQMTAFGPYVKPITLDFVSGLGGEKIFLIHGMTGAGKTTILDAISYALYGETSGKAREGKDMRSTDAPDDLLTEVEFTFKLGEKIFTAHRSPAQTIAKRRGSGLTSTPAAAELFCDGELIAIRDRAVTAKVEELIGFKAEQFRQVVLLPQGEFKKFLAADSDKRQEVLNVLFDSEPYKNIEDALAQRAAAATAQVDKLKTRLETLDAQLGDAGTDSVADVAAKILAAEEVLSERKKFFDAAQRQLTDGKNLARQFDELQRATSSLNEAQLQLEAASEKFSSAQTEYTRREGEQPQRKELEQRIRDLQKIQSTLTELNRKEQSLANERSELSAATAAFDKCDAKAKRYETRMADLKAQQASLAGADVEFERLKTLLDRARQRDDLTQKISRLENSLAMEQKKLSVVDENFHAAQIELARLQIVNSAAHLATTLEDGKPCPVCGSLVHPAVIAEAMPTAAELNAAEKNLERLTKEQRQQAGTVTKISTELDEAQRQLKDFVDVPDSPTVQQNHDAARKKSAALADCLQRIDTGDACIKDNRKALETAKTKRDAATVAVAKLESAIAEVKRDIPDAYLDGKRLAADLSAAEKIFAELDAAWNAAQKIFNAAKENRSARAATFETVSRDRSERQAALKDKTPPDVADLEQKFSAASESYGIARDEKTRLRTQLDTLKKISSERDDIKRQLSAKEKIADTWRRLSDVANGTGRGGAALKISFRRYYLSTMFDEVVTEANNRLKKMSGGRYSFHMKDAGRTRAQSAGLNLEIRDEFTGALRPVETLSGGESFLASLSLALGLAAVAQNNSGGIMLDTIFIDEGFGSLDSETLDAAIATIIDQSGGRLVGIISHVEDLKNQMPVRLEVIKGKTGSTAKFVS
ncbi:MAG: SMC family ATPase [Quinella sp. 2Q5]|nr:SMC family ATPase [Quinella sp. 2Q5]